MNIATGSLTFLGFIMLVLGAASKLMGVSLLQPLVVSPVGYLLAANSCLLMALIVDKFQKG